VRTTPILLKNCGVGEEIDKERWAHGRPYSSRWLGFGPPWPACSKLISHLLELLDCVLAVDAKVV
jgi:hypothetical protein